MPSRDELRLLRALPLDIKIKKTQQRIREWVNEYGEDGVYVSFSGGKDSTVLLYIARQLYPNIPAVFSNTGLEYREIQRFVKLHRDVTFIRPAMNFRDVIINYGYPVIGKEVAEYIWTVRHSNGEKYRQNRLDRLNGTFRRKDGQLSQYNRPQYKFLLDAPFEISGICCKKMKKDPFNKYSRETKRVPIMATMTEESRLREGKWLRNGCNSFKGRHPNSTPMAFWTEQDVLSFLYIHHDELVELIKDHYRKNGFSEDEIDEMNILHPWATCYGEIEPYIEKGGSPGQMILPEISKCGACMYQTTGCKRTGCIFCLFGIRQDPGRILRVQMEEPKIADYILRGGEVNQKGMWQPSKKGLGIWFVIEWLNAHGNLNIPYGGKYRRQYGNEFTEKHLAIKEEDHNGKTAKAGGSES